MSGTGSFDAEVVHARPRARAVAGGAAWAMIAPALFVAGGKLIGGGGGGPPSWLGQALLAIVAAGVVVAVAFYKRARRKARVEVGSDVVTIVEAGRRREIMKRSIENAMLVEGDDQKPVLELSLQGGEALLLDCGDAQRARDALALLALERERNVTRIRMYPRNQELLTTLAGGLVGMMAAGFAAGAFQSFLGALAPLVIIACMIPGMLYGARWLARSLPELRVGSDGVAIRSPARRGVVFIPHERVAEVAIVRRDLPKNPNAHVLELATTDGDRHVLAIHFAAQGELAEALQRRVREAIAERRATGAPLASLVALERQGRSTAAWLEALREMGREQADYRRARLTNEQLEDALGSGATSAEHRIGAAVLLAARGEPDAETRIRIASEETADPAIKRALLAVAEGEAEAAALEEAIEAAATDAR